jgi:hypothetical protein
MTQDIQLGSSVVNTTRHFVAVALFIAVTSQSIADYPPLLSNTETQPPTVEDEAWRAWRRLERCQLCLEPIMIPQTVIFYPCAPGRECGKPVHVSYKGSYGTIYPGPYYLPTPRIAVHDQKLCSKCNGHAEHAVEIIVADDSTALQLTAVSGVPQESAILTPMDVETNTQEHDNSIDVILPESGALPEN